VRDVEMMRTVGWGESGDRVSERVLRCGEWWVGARVGIGRTSVEILRVAGWMGRGWG
jgi:hypothetical protein